MPLDQLFRCKSLDQLVGETSNPQHQLRRVLGPVQLTMLGVGAIVGAGIFSTPGTAAAGGGEHIGAGPALIISFLIVAVACGFAALCYSEFAAMVPVSGSAYTYAYATLGELAAWLIGWDLVLLLPDFTGSFSPAPAGLARHGFSLRLSGCCSGRHYSSCPSRPFKT